MSISKELDMIPQHGAASRREGDVVTAERQDTGPITSSVSVAPPQPLLTSNISPDLRVPQLYIPLQTSIREMIHPDGFQSTSSMNFLGIPNNPDETCYVDATRDQLGRDNFALDTSLMEDCIVKSDFISKGPQVYENNDQAGKRFSLSSARVLKQWLANNTHHPYPTVGDVEVMIRQTGLQKPQILNWFSNARRRKKFVSPSFTTSAIQISGSALATSIPRPPTPFMEQLNPLERWKSSPPEAEPASALDIASALSDASDSRARTGSYGSQQTAGRTRSVLSGSSASASSVEGSESSYGSHSSAYSNTSDISRTNFNYIRKSRRRRRMANHHANHSSSALSQRCHRFQCTFCTETFSTKHSWQRHERSLHLSLEQWECCPNGPLTMNHVLEPTCVYCGLVNPESSHFESHNHSFCSEREREERIFYRKDHLMQHLRLVHQVQGLKWPIEAWKTENSQVRSRCGFCDASLQSWRARIDHLAEHFKDGSTMADWTGTWGFEASMLGMVENAMPPYLIDYERNSPLPFTTSQGAPYGPASAFELLQSELEYFSDNYFEVHQCTPSDRLLHLEACCIILGAEMLYRYSLPTANSWLRDLLMAAEDVTMEARKRPLKSAANSRFTQLRIHGKQNIFEDCVLEASLCIYVNTCQTFAAPEIENSGLQQQACSIIQQMPSTTALFKSLLVGLIYSSDQWLNSFRARAGLPVPGNRRHSTHQQEQILLCDTKNSCVANNRPSSDIGTLGFDLIQRSEAKAVPNKGHKSVSLNDSNVYRGLTKDLSRFVANVTSLFNPSSHIPTDEELQYQARWIMYDDDDSWNQTPADNPDWLLDFKRECGLC